MPAQAGAAVEAAVLETPWLTVEEAARYCRMRPATIERAAKNGKLRSSGGGQGKQRLFRTEWLDEWLEHHR